MEIKFLARNIEDFQTFSFLNRTFSLSITENETTPSLQPSPFDASISSIDSMFQEIKNLQSRPSTAISNELILSEVIVGEGIYEMRELDKYKLGQFRSDFLRVYRSGQEVYGLVFDYNHYLKIFPIFFFPILKFFPPAAGHF